MQERGIKPRAKGPQPIFPRPTSRGWYWYCHVRKPNGERPQRALGLPADDSRESWVAAVAAYYRKQALATNGEPDRAVRRPRKTLGKALEALAREQELAGLTDHTKHVTLWAASKLLAHWGPDHDIESITAADLVSYATEAKGSRVPASVRHEFGTLKRAMRAVDVVCPRCPKLGNQSSKPQRPLTEVEVRRVIMAAEGDHKTVLLVFILLGVRRGEYRLLSEVDWERQLIHVCGTKTARSDRWVPIPDELWEHMLELRSSGAWSGFPKYGYKMLYNIVRTACERAGLGSLHPNDMRGTQATLLALGGVSPAERAAIQGNSEAMQIRTYSQPHTQPEALRGAVAKMPRIRPKKGLSGSVKKKA